LAEAKILLSAATAETGDFLEGQRVMSDVACRPQTSDTLKLDVLDSRLRLFRAALCIYERLPLRHPTSRRSLPLRRARSY
jgi:hypothetical protein